MGGDGGQAPGGIRALIFERRWRGTVVTTFQLDAFGPGLGHGLRGIHDLRDGHALSHLPKNREILEREDV